MSIFKQTSYWNHTGRYQDLYTKLNDLIPAEGAVPDARTKNRKLEKLRVAANCYYDLFNNGLCNRAAEFRRVFGFGGKMIVASRYQDIGALEELMDEIILAAALEQGLAKIVPIE
jgi:hypothetical protein